MKKLIIIPLVSLLLIGCHDEPSPCSRLTFGGAALTSVGDKVLVDRPMGNHRVEVVYSNGRKVIVYCSALTIVEE